MERLLPAPSAGAAWASAAHACGHLAHAQPLSGAAASAGCNVQRHQPASSRYPGTRAVRRPFSPWLAQVLRGSSGRGCQHAAASCLQQIDYTFYNRLGEEGKEITEEFLWGRLETLLDYLSEDEREKVREALSLAYDSHRGQVRKSGEKYITHPVEVSRILAELQMDAESLCAGLLHDTVEDTDCVSFEEIEMWFGVGVRSIVEGETRFSKIGNFAEAKEGEAVDLKALDLQQLFLAMTEEVRIIIVKLADRLHNMRTLGSMPPHKQKKIADETLQVFAPLARLLGLYSIKEELEALSFKYSQPAAHKAMLEHVNNLRAWQLPAVDAACRTLEAVLIADPYLSSKIARVTVDGQNKALYSLHKKLQAKGIALKDLRDVAQLRVVLHPHPSDGASATSMWTGAEDKQLCYHVMGLVHTVWAPIPGFVKDYIATPKPNGYQSLHTTVLPLGAEPLFPLEVHIRTAAMHRLAQYGIACENWVAAFRSTSSSGASAVLDAELPKSPTESELAPVSTQNRADDEMTDPAAAQRQAARGQLGPETQRELLRGPINGTKLNGTPINSALSGVRISGAKVKGALDAAAMGGTSASASAQQSQVTGSPQLARLDQQVMTRRVNWLTSIREWQEEFLNTLPPREFVDCITDDLLGQGVFVFTPSGAPMRLPKGATVVDFAYHVHTDVGNHMKGAKVNGKLVPPDYALKNAEVVEIILYGNEVTVQDVLRHKRWQPTTRSARHKIAKFVKDHEHLLRPDPDSPEGRMLAHGIIDRVLDMGHPAAPVRAASWILVRCSDRSGLLAEVANIIAQHGHNIQEYNGNACSAGGTDDCFMQFVVEGELAQRGEMLSAIELVSTIASVSSGLGHPGPSAVAATVRQQGMDAAAASSASTISTATSATSAASATSATSAGATGSGAPGSSGASGNGSSDGGAAESLQARNSIGSSGTSASGSTGAQSVYGSSNGSGGSNHVQAAGDSGAAYSSNGSSSGAVQGRQQPPPHPPMEWLESTVPSMAMADPWAGGNGGYGSDSDGSLTPSAQASVDSTDVGGSSGDLSSGKVPSSSSGAPSPHGSCGNGAAGTGKWTPGVSDVQRQTQRRNQQQRQMQQPPGPDGKGRGGAASSSSNHRRFGYGVNWWRPPFG